MFNSAVILSLSTILAQGDPWKCIVNPLQTSKYLCYYVTKNLYGFSDHPLSLEASPCNSAPAGPLSVTWQAIYACDNLPYETLELITRPPGDSKFGKVTKSAPLPPSPLQPMAKKSLRFRPKLQTRFGSFHTCYSNSILEPGNNATELKQGFCRFDYSFPTVDSNGHAVGEYSIRAC
ncbi:hypothetical protein DSO57_1021349 [Entomophthora muscae]|uniref:Uncharacterized protein n=1 Tax=Entomophthora muscae TaxID=34485 RepID=A0ACC2SSF1_9FUNG|nr:hypothetical protein DSO57_1021349 [Entomophthora muscae]